MTQALEQITIHILGKHFSVCCPPAEAEDLRACAAELDQRMRAVKETSKIAGTEHIAIVAALNLAQDLLNIESKQEQQNLKIKQQIQALQNRITDSLSPQTELSFSADADIDAG